MLGGIIVLLFVAVMLPAVISVFIYDSATKEDLKPKKALYIYSVSNILINALCAAFKKFVLNTADAALSAGQDMTPAAFLNYLIMAVPAALFTGFIISLMKRGNVRVSKE